MNEWKLKTKESLVGKKLQILFQVSLKKGEIMFTG